jgi:mannose-6-phosphate isomerase-like protein (cupin superfamily)
MTESIVNRPPKIRTYRPWGYYEVLHTDECPETKLQTKVKKFVVNPGEELSYQSHQYREETWKVISGKGQIKKQIKDLYCNQEPKIILTPDSPPIHILKETKHSVSNPFDKPLVIIEIQHGERCDEDDITRYEDKYNRK